MAEEIVCGADAERHIAAVNEFIDAGYDHVYFHQVGPVRKGSSSSPSASSCPNFATSSRGEWRRSGPSTGRGI